MPADALREALRVSGELTSSVDNAGVCVVDRSLTVLAFQGPLFLRHGWVADEVIGRRLTDLVHPGVVRVLPHYREALAGRTGEMRMRTREGAAELHVQFAPILHAGEVVGARTLTVELPASDPANEPAPVPADSAIAVGSPFSFETAFEHAPAGMAVFSASSSREPFLHRVNRRLCERLGYSAERLMSLGAGELIHPEDAQRCVASACAVLEGMVADAELVARLRRADGAHVTMRLHLSRLPGPRQGRGWGICSATDVPAEDRPGTDEVAGVPELIEEAFDRAGVGLGLTDVETNRFVRVNDALCGVTERSSEELLALDSCLELIHPEERAEEQAALTRLRLGDDRVDRREKRLLHPDGGDVWVASSLSALRDRAGATRAGLVQMVGIGERKAREEAMRRELEEVAWLDRIRTALTEDRFVLHGQPIVDLSDGETVQQELLLRMLDADGSIVGPMAFLPVAERTGLIEEIDRWVIRRGVDHAAAGTPVEINVSAESMGRPRLLDFVEAELQRTGADPGRLVFEITETALMSDQTGGTAFAKRLSDIGCGFALDDFGTGFGGFTYLRHLPVNFIKIDRDFVRELPRSERDVHLVRTIVNLAEGLGQQTIAEGVEDEETLGMLRDLGVDFAQGYHLGRPAPLAEPLAR